MILIASCCWLSLFMIPTPAWLVYYPSPGWGLVFLFLREEICGFCSSSLPRPWFFFWFSAPVCYLAFLCSVLLPPASFVDIISALHLSWGAPTIVFGSLLPQSSNLASPCWCALPNPQNLWVFSGRQPVVDTRAWPLLRDVAPRTKEEICGGKRVKSFCGNEHRWEREVHFPP